MLTTKIPLVYCDWGGRSDYNKTAWLKSDEVADIVNVVMLARADSSVNEHLYQTDNQILPEPTLGMRTESKQNCKIGASRRLILFPE